MFSNEQYGKRAILGHYLFLGICIACVLSEIVQYFYLERNPTTYGPNAAASFIDWMQFLLYLAYFGILVFLAITYIMWFRRAYLNLTLIGIYTRYSSWWSVGGWLIPIANFFVPYQIMVDLHVRTGRIFDETRYQYHYKKSYIIIWWIFFLLASVFATIAGETLDYETVEQMQLSSVLYAISNVFDIAAVLTSLQVIRQYRKLETLLFQLITSGTIRPAEALPRA